MARDQPLCDATSSYNKSILLLGFKKSINRSQITLLTHNLLWPFRTVVARHRCFAFRTGSRPQERWITMFDTVFVATIVAKQWGSQTRLFIESFLLRDDAIYLAALLTGARFSSGIIDGIFFFPSVPTPGRFLTRERKIFLSNGLIVGKRRERKKLAPLASRPHFFNDLRG